jgi:hypothetical protein
LAFTVDKRCWALAERVIYTNHKRTKLETLLAKIVLAVPAYGHFCIEHNRGHHRDVATPDDPASARMGVPVRSLQNKVLQSYIITVVLQAGGRLCVP